MALHPTMRPYHRALLKFWRTGGWEICFLRLRGFRGFCFGHKTDRPKIVIDPMRDALDTLIHEALHGCCPHDHESVVTRHASTITQYGGHEVLAEYWRIIAHRVNPLLSPAMRGMMNHPDLKTSRWPQRSVNRDNVDRYYYPLVWPFLTQDPCRIVFSRLYCRRSSWCFRDRHDDPLVIIDVRGDTFRDIIFQILGFHYRDTWTEQRLYRVAGQIVSALSHQEIVALWRAVGTCLPKHDVFNQHRINFDDSAPVLPPTRQPHLRAVAAKRR